MNIPVINTRARALDVTLVASTFINHRIYRHAVPLLRLVIIYHEATLNYSELKYCYSLLGDALLGLGREYRAAECFMISESFGDPRPLQNWPARNPFRYATMCSKRFITFFQVLFLNNILSPPIEIWELSVDFVNYVKIPSAQATKSILDGTFCSVFLVNPGNF
jgi:hypothetical protein